MASLDRFLNDVARSLTTTGNGVALEVAGILGTLEPNLSHAVTCNATPEPLQQALSSPDCLAIAQPIADFADRFHWIGARDIPDQSSEFIGDFYFCRIVGEDDLYARDGFRCGLYLQLPNSNYPPHKHAAVELYLPLSGTARWQVDDGPFMPVAPGTLIHHATYQPHATRTFDEPLLAFWSWTGDTRFETYSYLNP